MKANYDKMISGYNSINEILNVINKLGSEELWQGKGYDYFKLLGVIS